MSRRCGGIATVGLAALTATLWSPPSAAGQGTEDVADASFGAAAVGGVFGGAVGFFGGLGLGASSGDLGPAVATAVLGQVVGIAVGAHTFNGAKGNFLADLGVSAGWLAAGLLLGSAIDSADNEIYVVATIGQIIGTAATEVRTSPRTHSRRPDDAPWVGPRDRLPDPLTRAGSPVDRQREARRGTIPRRLSPSREEAPHVLGSRTPPPRPASPKRSVSLRWGNADRRCAY